MKDYVLFSKEDLIEFEYYVKKNNKELNKDKVAYEVRWGGMNNFFYVKLLGVSTITLEDILKKMDTGVDKPNSNL